MSNIAFLVPVTSRGRNWTTFEETCLYNYFIKSLTEIPGLNYTLYLGVDSDDTFCLSETFNEGLRKTFKFPFKIIKFEGIGKGHVTKMWNVLFENSYSDGCDYFVQCGDDVEFIDQDWLEHCIAILKNNNNVGVSGPIDINTSSLFLTQSVVSRKHMEIFGYYFPEEIKNWYCDNWINDVYKSVNMLFIVLRRCKNSGGKERYDIVHEGRNVLNSILKPSEEKLIQYLKQNTR